VDPLSLGKSGVDAVASVGTRRIVADVVFPTGIDRRDDLGTPDRFDVYYGMADNRIGAARLDLPDHLGPMSTHLKQRCKTLDTWEA
jgi:hypothetical protein